MPLRPALFLPLAFFLFGCDLARRRVVPDLENVTTYEARGVLQKIDAPRRKAVIAHETIPGFMEAMTMEFDVADGEALAVLQPGDTLTFRLTVNDSRSWIDQLKKNGRVEIVATAQPAMESLPPGALLPDCTLVDQRGAAFHLSDFRGRALAFTFIFTRCPLPDFCPLMNRNLAEVRRALSADANWHLLSISFDPEYDTPARLAEYARPYESESGHWTFATGTPEDIRKLGGAFGLMAARNGATFDHTLRTVVVDAAGRVQKIFIGNEWKPAELIEEMRRAMAAKP